VVSAHTSASDRKPALRSTIAAIVFKRSRVDRACQSSRHQQQVAGVEPIEQAGKLRPVGFSSARHFAETPCLPPVSATPSTWPVMLWPSVNTRAQP
jgi:hypothetical protein